MVEVITSHHLFQACCLGACSDTDPLQALDTSPLYNGLVCDGLLPLVGRESGLLGARYYDTSFCGEALCREHTDKGIALRITAA